MKQAGLETVWSQMCSNTLTKISRMVQMADYTPKNDKCILTIWYTQFQGKPTAVRYYLPPVKHTTCTTI